MPFIGDPGSWYEEGEHPRGPGGKWISKGGADIGSTRPAKRKLAVADSKEIAKYKEVPKISQTKMMDDLQRQPKATATEKAAIDRYIAQTYTELNTNLRTDRVLPPKLQKDADALDAVISRGKLRDDTLLYRYVNGPMRDVINKLEPGAKFIDKGFSSTMIGKDWAFEIVLNTALMMILAEKGTNAAIGSRHLGEVILARDSKLEYLGENDDGSKVFKLYQDDEVKTEHIQPSVKYKEATAEQYDLLENPPTSTNKIFKRLRPAIMDNHGEVYVGDRGQTHYDIAIKRFGVEDLENYELTLESENLTRGFVDTKEQTFYEAARAALFAEDLLPEPRDTTRTVREMHIQQNIAQQKSLEALNIKPGKEVPVKRASEPLAKAGFKTGSAKKMLPSKMYQELVKEGKLTEPTEVSELHAISAKGFADGLKDLDGTILSGLKENVGDIPVVFASYEPHGASMTTVHGGGGAAFLINTSCDYAQVFAEKKPGSYSAAVALKEFEKTKDLQKAVYTQSRLSAIHEFVHLVDAAMGGALTDTFVSALTLESRAESPEQLGKWLNKNISNYALASPKEAVAEGVCKYINEGKLPGFLNNWAQIVIRGQHGTSRKKAA